MHNVLMTAGSRGDVQPYVALDLDLQQAGHKVRLAVAEVVDSLADGPPPVYVSFGCMEIGDPKRLPFELLSVSRIYEPAQPLWAGEFAPKTVWRVP